MIICKEILDKLVGGCNFSKNDFISPDSGDTCDDSSERSENEITEDEDE